jgi:DNA-binding GntR family transcriptional regulator
VPALSGADVRDLFFVRTPLELEAVTRIVEHSLALQDVEQCLQALRSLPQSASWAERVESHTAFHIALIDAAGSTRLSRIYPAMQDEMQLCLAQLHGSYPGSQDLYVEHRQLLDAIKSGSTDRAREEMRQHLHRALRNLGEDPANST